MYIHVHVTLQLLLHSTCTVVEDTNYPPDVNESLHPVLVARIPVDTFGHQYSQFPLGSRSDGFCKSTVTVYMYWDTHVHVTIIRVVSLMKWVQEEVLLHLLGHAIITVLWVIPPRPAFCTLRGIGESWLAAEMWINEGCTCTRTSEDN